MRVAEKISMVAGVLMTQGESSLPAAKSANTQLLLSLLQRGTRFLFKRDFRTLPLPQTSVKGVAFVLSRTSTFLRALAALRVLE